jgi:predicted small secreted protein
MRSSTASLKGTIMRLFITLLAAAFLGTLAGCNTIEGAGRDLERGGEKVQDTARDVKRSM